MAFPDHPRPARIGAHGSRKDLRPARRRNREAGQTQPKSLSPGFSFQAHEGGERRVGGEMPPPSKAQALAESAPRVYRDRRFDAGRTARRPRRRGAEHRDHSRLHPPAQGRRDRPRPYSRARGDRVEVRREVQESLRRNSGAHGAAAESAEAENRIPGMNPAALANEPLRSTDIGILPESWRVVGLGEALRQAQYGLSVRGQKSGSYPILRMNCQERGRVVFRDLQFVDLDDRTLESYRLNEGDILFNRTNSHELVGRSALFDGSRTAVFASYLLRLATDQSKLLPAFLNFYLASEPAQESLKSFATRGVSQSNISASKLRLLRIPQPPIEEQSAIADVLSKLQATVDRQDRIVGTLKELKAATMAKLFREGLRGEPLKQTEIGEIPQSWEVVPLGQLTESSAFGPRFSAALYSQNGNVATLRTTDIDEDGSINYATMPTAMLDIEKFGTHLLKDSDLVITRSGTCGIAAVFEPQ